MSMTGRSIYISSMRSWRRLWICWVRRWAVVFYKLYIVQHGSIVVDNVEPPFDSISHEGIDGVFTPDNVGDLIAVLEPFIRQETQHDR